MGKSYIYPLKKKRKSFPVSTTDIKWFSMRSLEGRQISTRFPESMVQYRNDRSRVGDLVPS
jgi:hypothetical protein